MGQPWVPGDAVLFGHRPGLLPGVAAPDGQRLLDAGEPGRPPHPATCQEDHLGRRTGGPGLRGGGEGQSAAPRRHAGVDLGWPQEDRLGPSGHRLLRLLDFQDFARLEDRLGRERGPDRARLVRRLGACRRAGVPGDRDDRGRPGRRHGRGPKGACADGLLLPRQPANRRSGASGPASADQDAHASAGLRQATPTKTKTPTPKPTKTPTPKPTKTPTPKPTKPPAPPPGG